MACIPTTKLKQPMAGWKKAANLPLKPPPNNWDCTSVGAINVANDKITHITKSYEKINSNSIADFLGEIQQKLQHQDKIHIISDNASYTKATWNSTEVCFGIWGFPQCGARLVSRKKFRIYRSPKDFGIYPDILHNFTKKALKICQNLKLKKILDRLLSGQ